MSIKHKNMKPSIASNKLKFLYALGLLLCLSTVASSNECTRFYRRTSGKGCSASAPCDAAAPTLSASSDATGETDHAPSLTLVKLLYI